MTRPDNYYYSGETKRNETKAWFRGPFMPSRHESDYVYSPAPGACTWHSY